MKKENPFGVSNRLQNLLNAAEIDLLDLTIIDPRLMFACRNYGKGCHEEVLQTLSNNGLTPGTWRLGGGASAWESLNYYTSHRDEVTAEVKLAMPRRRYPLRFVTDTELDPDTARALNVRFVAFLARLGMEIGRDLTTIAPIIDRILRDAEIPQD